MKKEPVPMPTREEVKVWENRLVDAVLKARFDQDAHDLAHLCSELLDRLRACMKDAS